MKGMILAAGKGTRVRPITYTIPKPMIPLIRTPVIEHIVMHLKSHGVDQIIVNTSHLAPVIEGYLRDGDRYGIQIAYSFEGELIDGELRGEALGSAGGMKKIQDFSGFFDDTFIVVCGDALTDPDIGAAVSFHKAKGATATIILRDVPREDVYRYGVVQLDGDGRILRFQEKPKVEKAVSNTINTGIYLFEPGIFDFIPSGREFDIGGDLLPLLISKGEKVCGLSLPFQWVDLGSIRDYWDATRLALEGKIRGFSLPGIRHRDGVHSGINVGIDFAATEITPPVYIGSSTSIAPEAVIQGPAVIGTNCIIESGAIVRECIVGDYTRISSAANLHEKIIFGSQCIQPDGSSFDLAEFDIGWVIDDSRKKGPLPETHRMLMDLVKGLGV